VFAEQLIQTLVKRMARGFGFALPQATRSVYILPQYISKA
jgi:hypothetical protein